MAKLYICQKEGCNNEIIQNRGNRRKFCYDHRRYKNTPTYLSREDEYHYTLAKKQFTLLKGAWG